MRIGREHFPAIAAIAEALPQWFTEDGRRKLAVDLHYQQGYVALVESAPVGFLTIYVVESVAHIGWMGVHPDMHRSGLGRTLVEVACAELGGHGVSRVRVDTLGDGVDYQPYAHTRAFYRGIGFSDVACIAQNDPEWPERLTLERTIATAD
jgi:ribosomal protein S18 acetylase RimI-like enzyme